MEELMRLLTLTLQDLNFAKEMVKSYTSEIEILETRASRLRLAIEALKTRMNTLKI